MTTLTQSSSAWTNEGCHVIAFKPTLLTTMHTLSSRRIGLGYIEIAGNLSSLEDGLRSLGVKLVVCYILKCSRYKSLFVNTHSIANLHLRLIYWFRLIFRSNFLEKIFWELLLPLRLVIFVHQIFSVDTLYILSGHSLLPFHIDYLIWKFIPGKKLIVSFHGSDSRPPFLNGKFVHRRLAIWRLIAASLNRFLILKRVEALSDAIINTPPQAVWMRKPFVNQLLIGKPVSSAKILQYAQPSSKPSSSYPIQIVHIPSSSSTKGTTQIQMIISRLKTELPELFVYNELHNLSYPDCLSAIAESDILIDQMYSDLPCPNISKEGYILGTVPLVGGYYANYLRDSLLGCSKITTDFLLGFNFTTPDKFESLVRDCILNLNAYRQRSLEQAKLLSNLWSSRAVASHILHLVHAVHSNTLSESISFLDDPSCINYRHGCGVSKDDILSVASKIRASLPYKLVDCIFPEVFAPLP